jgi:hypothetical protein
VQNLLREVPPPGYPFDGITETWFNTSEDATRAFVNDPFKQATQGLADFCDIDRSVLMLCHVTHRWPRT